MRQQAGATRGVGPEAVWHPEPSFRERVIERCSSSKVRLFGECFVSVMKDSKASPRAISFTESIGNTGYLRGFREAGIVDIAFVEYPFRANENYGCFLVNGDPPVINIDDNGILQKIDLRKDSQFTEIATTFPKVDIWPGDRYGADCIIPDTLKEGQRFLVTYRLLNGCHACDLLGLVRVAFDFDRAGKLTGAELLGVEAAVALFNDPEKPVNVTTGEKFAFVLESNRTTGYRWEVSTRGESAIVNFVGTEYSEQGTGSLGAGGKEVLTFEAAGRGKTEITLRYVRPWEKNAPPAKTATFKVSVD